MRSFKIVLTLTLLVMSSCRLFVEQTEATADEYAVYSAYLNSILFFRNIPRADTVIIRGTTAINPSDVNPDMPWW